MTLSERRTRDHDERRFDAATVRGRLEHLPWWPAVGLFVLAPWMAEMSWGGIPFTQMPLVLLFLGPVYGAAAILIREFARRTGRGWPTMLLWAAAFGVFQSGVVDQSLFSRNYGGEDFTQPLQIPGIGASLVYVIAFVSGHVVASIGAPIALVESCSRRAETQRWFTGREMGVVAVLYIIGSLINHVGVKNEEGGGFQARPEQTLIAAGVALALVVTGMLVRTRQRHTGWAPPWWALLIGAFVADIFYLPSLTSFGAVVAVVVIAGVALVIFRWSGTVSWSRGHTFALAIGVALTGAVVPFIVEPYKAMSPGSEREADIVAAGVCLCLVAVCTWLYARSRPIVTGREDGSVDLPGRT